MNRPGRIAKTLALCLLISSFSLGCSLFPTSTPPEETPREAVGTTEARREQISRDAIVLLRRLNVHNLAFLRQSLPPVKYRLALEFLIPEIQALAQQVVAVSATGSGAEPDGLLAAVDSLARAAGEYRRYIDADQEDALAAAFALQADARATLAGFLEGTTLAAGPELRELLQQAGHVEIEAAPTAVSRVALGPFSSAEVAQQVRESAAAFGAVIRENGLPTVWLGPFIVAAEARAVAAQWREQDVEAAVHEDTVYDFQVAEVVPVQGQSWREAVWFHDMDQPMHFIAITPDGSAVFTGDTSGTIQRRSGQGAHEWTLSFALPTFAMAAARGGESLFAAGIGVRAIVGDGGLHWSDALPNHDVILERAAISDDGQTMVAATSNAEGVGRAFLFSESRFDEDNRAFAWETQSALAGVNSFHLSPDGNLIALGAVGGGRFQVLVVNERGEKLMGSDFIEPIVGVALADANQKIVVLTERHVSQFDVASQRIEWQRPARGRTLAVSQPGDIIYVGGVHGIAAFYRDGCPLWLQDAMPVTQIVANRDYLVGLSQDIRLVVLRFDGSILGTVTPLAPIRDFAVTTDGNLLVTLDDDNRLSAWRLPPTDINESAYPC